MDKTIRVGDLTITGGKFYLYVSFGNRRVAIMNLVDEKTTLEYALEMDSSSCKTPNELNTALTVRESVKLYKFALEQGMNEHEDVTYWLRDYIVEKIRETQTVS